LISYILKLQCLSIRPGPETHIPKKTHIFSFQVSRNEGFVCLGTWGRGRTGQGIEKGGQGRPGQFVCLTNKGRAGQGRALFSVTLAFTDRPSDDRV